ncbi:MAG: multicopper oxidase domain-containing protein [Betaproteobacteria bacterium]
MVRRRRDFLKAAGALACAALPGRAFPDYGAVAGRARLPDFCAADGASPALFVPGRQGLFGRLAPDGARLTMRAGAIEGTGGPWQKGIAVEHRGVRFVNPTLVLRRGESVTVDFDNALAEPSSVHWHGLAVATRNDGAVTAPVGTSQRYTYAFDVRDRAALYWYHPHPHGLTAGQVYGGMFGLIEVEDEDERALRAALDLDPGRSEIPLVLQDRRGAGYAATDADRMHGWLGNQVVVNGAVCPHLDVATRIYRFRVLNASNARTYLLALRSADGKLLPFTLIGTDGGLLAAPRRCEQSFLASAERIDILVDLSDAAIGDTVVLETRAFDPMHMEAAMAAVPGTDDHAAMSHATPTPAAAGNAPGAVDHAAMGHGESFPEGASRGLLQLRVRERIAYRAAIPARLSTIPPIAAVQAAERPLRLGFAKARWRINDRVFAMGDAPIAVQRDTVETWLVRNYFNSMPHAMHLHGFHFRVIERQTSPAQVAALKVDERGRLATDLGWKDTVLVWPGESVRIAIDFAMPFAGEQTYLFHCHNLEHEDGGMMLGVKVT